MDHVARILSENYCEFSSGIEEGTFELYVNDYRRCSFADDLVEELAPLLSEGEIDVRNDETEGRFSFCDGKYTYCEGDKYICFPGFEDEFAESLPDKVVQAVLRKHAKDRLSAS